MTTSDDEFGFDDFVLDDRTLAILDAAERKQPPNAPPRSSPERPPAKRLKTNQGWVPLYGQQREPSAPVPRGLPRSRFSLEDTDLPEITINNRFYSGPSPPPDRFFAPSPRPRPSANPPSGTADSDVVLLPTPTIRNVQAPAAGRN